MVVYKRYKRNQRRQRDRDLEAANGDEYSTDSEEDSISDSSDNSDTPYKEDMDKVMEALGSLEIEMSSEDDPLRTELLEA